MKQIWLLLAALASVVLTGLVAAPVSAAGTSSVSFTTYDVPGHHGTFIEGVNSSGDLAGQVVDSGNSSGFITRNGVVTVFDYPGTSGVTQWATISDNDTVAGQFIDANNVGHSFTRSPQGVFTQLDDPAAGTAPGDGTFAFAIDDAGVVSGFYADNAGVMHGFLEHGGVFTTVDEPGAGSAAGQGTTVTATTSGILTGSYFDSSNEEHNFVDEHGRLSTFDVPGFALIAVTSNDGQVTTGTFFGKDHVGRAFLLTAGGMADVTEPNANAVPGQGTYAVAVDNAGNAIAGGYWDSAGVVHGWIGTI